MSSLLHSAPPRFRAEPLAEYYVRLVDVIFAVTLTQTLVIYRNEIVAFSPRLLIETLALVYLTVALSWVGYHRSIMKYPYNKSAWSGVRVVLDIFILVVYAFLAFAAKEPPKVIMGLAVVFILYAVDGCTRIAEWCDTKVSKPWLSAIFACLLLWVWRFLHQGRIGPTTAVIACGFLVIAFRPIRKSLGYPRLLIVGVDVDGVLGEQIPALLRRLQSGKQIGMGLSKENIAEWAFTFDGTDIAKEMEEALLDETFVSSMAPIEGAAPALKALHKHFHIVIATSRPIVTQKATAEWLRKNFRFHEVANTRQTGKSVLGLEILIDDNVDNARSFVASGGMALLFDQPWNRSAENEQDLKQFFDDKRLVRCTTWETVVAALEEFRTNGTLTVSQRLTPTRFTASRRNGLIISADRAVNLLSEAENRVYNIRRICGECISMNEPIGPIFVGTTRPLPSLWPTSAIVKAG